MIDQERADARIEGRIAIKFERAFNQHCRITAEIMRESKTCCSTLPVCSPLGDRGSDRISFGDTRTTPQQRLLNRAATVGSLDFEFRLRAERMESESFSTIQQHASMDQMLHQLDTGDGIQTHVVPV